VLLNDNNAGADHFSPIYKNLNKDLNKSLKETAFYHDLVMYIIIVCYLNAPLNLMAKIFLVRKTNRTKI
jgi:hypothetical protein